MGPLFCSSVKFSSARFSLSRPGKDCAKKNKEIVKFFNQSSLAQISLEQEQEALGIKKMELQVSCKTRWNSIYRMLQLNLVNRIPINRVLTQKKNQIF